MTIELALLFIGFVVLVAGGVRVNIGDINIGNSRSKKDDTE